MKKKKGKPDTWRLLLCEFVAAHPEVLVAAREGDKTSRWLLEALSGIYKPELH